MINVDKSGVKYIANSKTVAAVHTHTHFMFTKLG